MSKIPKNNDFRISDKILESEYLNRAKYGFFKRMIIERKYNKLYEKEINQAYLDAKIKR